MALSRSYRHFLLLSFIFLLNFGALDAYCKCKLKAEITEVGVGAPVEYDNVPESPITKTDTPQRYIGKRRYKDGYIRGVTFRLIREVQDGTSPQEATCKQTTFKVSYKLLVPTTSYFQEKSLTMKTFRKTLEENEYTLLANEKEPSNMRLGDTIQLKVQAVCDDVEGNLTKGKRLRRAKNAESEANDLDNVPRFTPVRGPKNAKDPTEESSSSSFLMVSTPDEETRAPVEITKTNEGLNSSAPLVVMYGDLEMGDSLDDSLATSTDGEDSLSQSTYSVGSVGSFSWNSGVNIMESYMSAHDTTGSEPKKETSEDSNEDVDIIQRQRPNRKKKLERRKSRTEGVRQISSVDRKQTRDTPDASSSYDSYFSLFALQEQRQQELEDLVRLEDGEFFIPGVELVEVENFREVEFSEEDTELSGIPPTDTTRGTKYDEVIELDVTKLKTEDIEEDCSPCQRKRSPKVKWWADRANAGKVTFDKFDTEDSATESDSVVELSRPSKSYITNRLSSFSEETQTEESESRSGNSIPMEAALPFFDENSESSEKIDPTKAMDKEDDLVDVISENEMKPMTDAEVMNNDGLVDVVLESEMETIAVTDVEGMSNDGLVDILPEGEMETVAVADAEGMNNEDGNVDFDLERKMKVTLADVGRPSLEESKESDHLSTTTPDIKTFEFSVLSKANDDAAAERLSPASDVDDDEDDALPTSADRPQETETETEEGLGRHEAGLSNLKISLSDAEGVNEQAKIHESALQSGRGPKDPNLELAIVKCPQSRYMPFTFQMPGCPFPVGMLGYPFSQRYFPYHASLKGSKSATEKEIEIPSFTTDPDFVQESGSDASDDISSVLLSSGEID